MERSLAGLIGIPLLVVGMALVCAFLYGLIGRWIGGSQMRHTTQKMTWAVVDDRIIGIEAPRTSLLSSLSSGTVMRRSYDLNGSSAPFGVAMRGVGLIPGSEQILKSGLQEQSRLLGSLAQGMLETFQHNPVEPGVHVQIETSVDLRKPAFFGGTKSTGKIILQSKARIGWY